MLSWVSLLGGLALIFGTGGLVLSMRRAEHRARRNLYRSLGLAETTVEFLMERNRDVLSEITYVRHEGEAAVIETAEPPVHRDRNVTFLRPSSRSGRPAPSTEGERPARTAEQGPASSDGHTRH